MAFTPPSTDPPLLCVASDHGNVHIFRLTSELKGTKHAAKAVAKTLLSAVVHKTPTNSGEKIAKVELRCMKGSATVCAIRPRRGEGQHGEHEEQGLRLLVATSEGILYEYSLGSAEMKVPVCVTLEGQWVFAS